MTKPILLAALVTTFGVVPQVRLNESILASSQETKGETMEDDQELEQDADLTSEIFGDWTVRRS